MTRWEYGVLWTTTNAFGHTTSVGWTPAGSSADMVESLAPAADEAASAAHGRRCAQAHGLRQRDLGAAGWELVAIAGPQMHFRRQLAD